MKTLLTIFTLVFTVMFSSTSFGEWTRLGKNLSGDTYYLDFERIRKNDGSVYFWVLSDYLKPTKYGDLSSKVYYEGDCKLFRMMRLSSSYHKQPMGGGTGDVNTLKQDWSYPSPNSVIETILKKVCSR